MFGCVLNWLGGQPVWAGKLEDPGDVEWGIAHFSDVLSV